MCQAYSWSYAQAMSMTMNQIVLLNHAASTNYKNSEIRAKHSSAKKAYMDENDPVVMNGKRLSELSDEESDRYYSGIM